MAVILPQGKQQFFDSNGDPLVGGKLYTWEPGPGITTPKATHQDAAGTILNTNPIILNARGEALVFWTGGYNVKLETSAGSLIYTVENINTVLTVESLSASDGSSKVGFIQAGAGAVAMTVQSKLRQFLDLRDYTDFAAALTAIGSTSAVLWVGTSYVMTANVTIPSTLTLMMMPGGVITTTGYTLTINGRFEADPVQCFTGSGAVVFGKGTVEAIWPHWWGAKGDAAIDGSSGTDCTSAFAKAITASTLNGAGAVAILPILLGPGNFMTGNVVLVPANDVRGAGRHVTNLVAKPGTVGKWWTDNGSASKIILTDIAWYAHGEAGLTHGLQLGRNGTEHGTEGYLKDLWVRDLTAAGAIALDVNSNVGWYDTLTLQNSAVGIMIGGSPSGVSNIGVMQPQEVGADFSYCNVDQLHIEAPANACIPLKITRNSSINRCSVALANNTTISHLMQLDASANSWSMEGFELFFSTLPATVTVTNGNFKRSDGTYFGGNATAGSLNGVGSYSSEQGGQKLQSFTLRVINTAGTLQHRIATTSGNASNFVSKINAAAAALTNTPTGADAATAMAAGGKIGSATPSIFWFDTAAQKDSDSICVLGPVLTTNADSLVAAILFVSIDINGVTRTRLGIQFYLQSTGAAYSLSTGNIAAAEYVQVSFMGYLS